MENVLFGFGDRIPPHVTKSLTEQPRSSLVLTRSLLDQHKMLNNNVLLRDAPSHDLVTWGVPCPNTDMNTHFEFFGEAILARQRVGHLKLTNALINASSRNSSRRQRLKNF